MTQTRISPRGENGRKLPMSLLRPRDVLFCVLAPMAYFTMRGLMVLVGNP